MTITGSASLMNTSSGGTELTCPLICQHHYFHILLMEIKMKTTEFFLLKKYMEKEMKELTSCLQMFLEAKWKWQTAITEDSDQEMAFLEQENPGMLWFVQMSAEEMMASSPELTQRTRSWSVFLIYILHLGSDIEMMYLLEKHHLYSKQKPH